MSSLIFDLYSIADTMWHFNHQNRWHLICEMESLMNMDVVLQSDENEISHLLPLTDMSWCGESVETTLRLTYE